MKHLIVTLALCVASNAPHIEALPNNSFEPIGEAESTNDTEATPNFEKIKIDHARTYVESIYPFAIKVQEKHGIPAPITLAIACLESGYGRSSNAQNKFNHLGIRTYNNGKAGYRKFSSIEACFDYYNTLFENPRYAALQKLTPNDNLAIWVKTLQESGYNQREGFGKKVMGMIRFINLDELV